MAPRTVPPGRPRPAVRAMALSILQEWRLTAADPAFRKWLGGRAVEDWDSASDSGIGRRAAGGRVRRPAPSVRGEWSDEDRRTCADHAAETVAPAAARTTARFAYLLPCSFSRWRRRVRAASGQIAVRGRRAGNAGRAAGGSSPASGRCGAGRLITSRRPACPGTTSARSSCRAMPGQAPGQAQQAGTTAQRTPAPPRVATSPRRREHFLRRFPRRARFGTFGSSRGWRRVHGACRHVVVGAGPAGLRRRVLAEAGRGLVLGRTRSSVDVWRRADAQAVWAPRAGLPDDGARPHQQALFPDGAPFARPGPRTDRTLRAARRAPARLGAGRRRRVGPARRSQHRLRRARSGRRPPDPVPPPDRRTTALHGPARTRAGIAARLLRRRVQHPGLRLGSSWSPVIRTRSGPAIWIFPHEVHPSAPAGKQLVAPATVRPPPPADGSDRRRPRRDGVRGRDDESTSSSTSRTVCTSSAMRRARRRADR